LQQARSPYRQIVVRRYTRQIRGADYLAIFPLSEMQKITTIDQLEHRLQQVVAIGPAAEHMQEQVELGRRRAIA
jgi:hypothetical protein